MNIKRASRRIIEIVLFTSVCWLFIIDVGQSALTSKGIARFLRECMSYTSLSAIVLTIYFYVAGITMRLRIRRGGIVTFFVCGMLLGALILPIRNYIYPQHIVLFALDAISIVILAQRLPDSKRAASWFVGWKDEVVTPEDFMEHVKAQKWAERMVVLVIVQSLVFAVVAYFIA